MPGYGIYNAAKFAVEGNSEALAQEAGPLGIQVTIVEPGAFRTDFLKSKSLMSAAKIIGDYACSSGRTRSAVPLRNGAQPGEPELTVKLIVDTVTGPNPPLRPPVGQDCIDGMRAKLKLVEDDIAAWDQRSVVTPFKQ